MTNKTIDKALNKLISLSTILDDSITQINDEMEQIDDLNSDEFQDLDDQYLLLRGQQIGLLKAIEIIEKIEMKGGE